MKDALRALIIQTSIIVGVPIALIALYYVRIVFVYIVLAVLLAYLMAKPVRLLRRFARFPAPLAFIVVLIAIFVVAFALGFAIGQRVYTEAYGLVREIPQIADRFEYKINKWLQKHYPGAPAIGIESYAEQFARTLGEALQENLPQTTAKAYAYAIKTFKGLLTFVLGLLLVPMLAYYFLIDVQKFKESFKAFIPQENAEKYEAGLAMINEMMGRYVRGQVILSVTMGFLITTGLLAFGVPYAFLLGVVGAAAELIPAIGPILSFIPALIFAFTVSPLTALFVTIFYILLHIFESQALVPRVMGKEIDLHPATVIVAMLVGAQAWGLLGVLVALPLAAAIKIILKVVFFERQKYQQKVA